MPNPTQSDLHIEQALTNISIAYVQDASEYIATKVFPNIPVEKQYDKYRKYSKKQWRESKVQKRAPGTESPGSGWFVDTDQYACDVYAVHQDIDEQTRSNADSVFNLDRDATQFVTNQLLLSRDLAWNEAYFKTGVWEVNKTGGNDFTKWTDANSDPIGMVDRYRIDFKRRTGFKPNFMVMGVYVEAALKQHPDIIDRIKYTQRGVVTSDLIATLFQIDEIYTSSATVAKGPDIPDMRLNDAAASYDFMTNSRSVLMGYSPKSPSLMTPAAGYTFTWKGYLGGNSQGVKIKKFPMIHLNSDRVEGEATWDMKVVCPDLGVYLEDVVDIPEEV